MASLIDKAKEFVAEKIANIETPEAELTGLSVKSFSTAGVTFLSSVDISNPYSHDLPIIGITYSLKSAGRDIASGKVPDPGWIKASGKTEVDVSVDVPYDFLISFLRDVGSDWDIDYELDVGLVIDLPIVGNITIPLKVAGEIKLPTLSDIF